MSLTTLDFLNYLLLLVFLACSSSCLLSHLLYKDRRSLEFGKYDSCPDDLYETIGWIKVHGDVFRHPSYIYLLSSIYGIGKQITAIVLIYIICSLFLIPFYEILYLFTFMINGYYGTKKLKYLVYGASRDIKPPNLWKLLIMSIAFMFGTIISWLTFYIIGRNDLVSYLCLFDLCWI